MYENDDVVDLDADPEREHDDWRAVAVAANLAETRCRNAERRSLVRGAAAVGAGVLAGRAVTPVIRRHTAAAAAAGVGVGLALLPSAQRQVAIAVLLAVVGLAAAFVFVVAMIGVALTPPVSRPAPAWRPAPVAVTVTPHVDAPYWYRGS
jgi:cyanate permease